MLYIEVDIDFTSADGPDIHSTESNTFSLTITISADTGPSLTGVVNTPSPTVAHIPVAEGSAVRFTVLANAEAMQLTSFTAPVFPLSQRGDLPIESGTPVRPVTLNETETSRATLSRAEEAMNTMNTIKTWESAVNVIKWVMDTVSPIAAV
jgi:hypothetical protein